MTVSSQTNNETFYGNGATTVWDLPFRFFNDADVRAYLIDPVTQSSFQLLLGTDYTLTGAGLPEQFGVSPGKITTTSPVVSGKQLYVERLMNVEQLTDIVNQGRFFPEVHEDVFDRTTMLIQQAIAEYNRALKRPIGKEYYDAQNRIIKNLADGSDNLDAVNIRTLRSYVDTAIAGVTGGFGYFLQAAAGAILRTFQSKMSDTISVLDFAGVDPTGATDSAVGIQKALDAAAGKILLFPKGLYIKSTSNRVHANTHLIFDPGCTLRRTGNTDSWMFVNGELGNNAYATGYNGDGFITVEGGYFDLGGIPGVRTAAAFIFGHSARVTFKDIVCANGYNSHNIELNSSTDAMFLNCKFLDQVYGDVSSSYEAINIDSANATGFPAFGAYDLTTDRNVCVIGCTFRNVQGGVSSHGIAAGQGQHTNIKVIGNTFDGIGTRGVRAQGWNEAIITGNRFNNCGNEAVSVLSSNRCIVQGNILTGVSQVGNNGFSAIRIAGDNNICGPNIIDNSGFPNLYSYPYGIASGNKNIIDTTGALPGVGFTGTGIVSNSGTLTQIDGLTLLYSGDPTAPSTITLADNINNYTQLLITTGVVAQYEFQTHIARPFNSRRWTVGGDKIVLKTINGSVTADIASLTSISILTSPDHIRQIYGQL